jgi:hypothetical protein
LFALLEGNQKRHLFEAGELELAEEKSTFYKRDCERTERVLQLQSTYMEDLEWADAEKTKRIEVLEKKYQDIPRRTARSTIRPSKKCVSTGTSTHHGVPDAARY